MLAGTTIALPPVRKHINQVRETGEVQRQRTTTKENEVGTHVLGITLEEYFHVGAFRDLIARGRWYRFEPRLEVAAQRSLDLLASTGNCATFFTHGWVAERYPDLIRRVAAAGHEIANSGYAHRGVRELTPPALLDEFKRSRDLLESVSGVRVRGLRIPDWIGPEHLPLIEKFADDGYYYDASLRCAGFGAADQFQQPYRIREGQRPFWEFPVPTISVAGCRVPIGGGNWFRQFPPSAVRLAVTRWMAAHDAPFSMYFHAWELDPGQPRLTGAGWIARTRHYRNLDRMADLVRDLLEASRFTGFAEWLGLGVEAATAPAVSERASLHVDDLQSPTPLIDVALVIPCYNEAETLPYLMNTLASVQRAFADRYRLHFVFVDDASADATWDVLSLLAGKRSDCTLVRHPVNRGVAHAILTGIASAPAELVCSIDADCTYDPHDIGRLVQELERGATLVTASPYHPDGHVVGVPSWRLALSRTLSAMYRQTLGSSLHTYTSCFRGYRRSAFTGVTLQHRGFLGVAETLSRSILNGDDVVEVPATLESRLIGRSKMRVLPVIVGHLRLLADLRRQPRTAASANGPVDTVVANA